MKLPVPRRIATRGVERREQRTLDAECLRSIIRILNNQLEGSVCGIHIGTSGSSSKVFWAFVMYGNTIDRNDGCSGVTDTQMSVDTGVIAQGCDIGTNYWEIDNAATNVPVINNISVLSGCRFSQSQTLIQPYGSFASSALINMTAPTISSGFGTSPSVVSNKPVAAGIYTFRVNVGTGGTASSGVVGLPTALNGWNCSVVDTTNNTGTRETGYTTTSVTVTAASSWAASDVLIFNCAAF